MAANKSLPQRVCLDANILLEILFRRSRYEAVVAELQNGFDGPNVRLCVSILTLDIVMYFVEAQKQSKDLAWQFLQAYEPLSVTSEDAEWAHDNDAGDYEDALQVGCARRHGCGRFITLDQKLAARYGSQLPVTTIR